MRKIFIFAAYSDAQYSSFQLIQEVKRLFLSTGLPNVGKQKGKSIQRLRMITVEGFLL